jgi:RND family efflux transporter MFP subunit
MKVLSCILLLMLGCSGNEKASLPSKTSSTPHPPKPPISAKAMGNKKATHTIRLGGQVVSPGKMLLAFQTPGTIHKLIAKPGMFFRKGQLLAELDSRDIALRAEATKLQYEQALNAKKMADRDYRIEKELHAQNIGSQVQFENIELNANNADLAARTAHTNYKIAQKALNDTKLLAPFNCVITKQFKSLGESSIGGERGNTVYELYETSDPEIRLEAPENLLSQIKIGHKIELKFPALNITLPGKVIRYVPVISEQGRNFTVVAKLNNPDPRIVPGYFVEGILQ